MSAAVIRTGVRLGLQILGGWESQAFDSPSEAPFFLPLSTLLSGLFSYVLWINQVSSSNLEQF